MEKRSRKPVLSTEVFAGKVVAPLITEHPLFKTPTQIKKVFPSIGMPNFKDEAEITKCFVDLKREGSFVWNVLETISLQFTYAKDHLMQMADNIQYLATSEEREKNKGKIIEIYALTQAIQLLIPCVDPRGRDIIGETMQSHDKRIVLKLYKDVIDPNEKSVYNGVARDKVLYKKGQSWSSIYNEVKEKSASFDVGITALDNTDAGRIFAKENMPNKKFHVVFSAEGAEGAWDIATMSMRGIKSCQRWDGEYPRCLIGSIFSRFVGIIYLTSGVPSDNYGVYKDLGTKMLRRCVVRYAIDAEQEKPCILLDRMYPETDNDVLKLFIQAIEKRTGLTVSFSPDLGNKSRHMYLPNEDIRNEIQDREWSYQDTPLKSKDDLNIFYLSHNEEEIKKDLKAFHISLALFLARKLEGIYSGDISVDPMVKKIANNIRMNTALMPFTEQVSSYSVNAFRSPSSVGILTSKSYYRKYLLEFIKQRKNIQAYATPHINNSILTFTSKTFETKPFIDYLYQLVIQFCKKEAVSLFN